ncbi:DUF6308 family protein [Chloroflexota bacterium]
MPIQDKTKAIIPLLNKRHEIESKLERVPSNINILDDYSKIPWKHWKQLNELFDTLRIKYISIARLTKMLHKKRPGLIPILDSVVIVVYIRSLLTGQGISTIRGGNRRGSPLL